jgi:hypothetical protein
MSEHPGAREVRPADPHPKLRLTALIAVIAGVVLLAAAAFVFSYSGIRDLARSGGVTPELARIYPLIFDAALVIAFAAALALRGAGWWTRAYVWLCTLALLAAVAAGDALRAMGVSLPRKPAAAALAVIPWALLLLAFGLWLAMLRHLRRSRLAARAARQAAPANGPNSRANLDALLERRPATAAPSLGGRLPAAAGTAPTGTADHGTAPTGAGPTGAGPTGAAPSSAAPTGAAPPAAGPGQPGTADHGAAPSSAEAVYPDATAETGDYPVSPESEGPEGFDDLGGLVMDGPEHMGPDEDVPAGEAGPADEIASRDQAAPEDQHAPEDENGPGDENGPRGETRPGDDAGQGDQKAPGGETATEAHGSAGGPGAPGGAAAEETGAPLDRLRSTPTPPGE